jgi:transcriptional regulator with XRE-family HTH domain
MLPEPSDPALESRIRSSRFARLLQVIRFYAALSPQTSTEAELAKPEFNIANSSPLSQRQLAKVLGVSSTMVHRYESGLIDPFEVGFGVLVRLALFTNIKIDNLSYYFSEGIMKEQALSSPADSHPDQKGGQLVDLILKLQGVTAGNDSV